MKKYYKAYDGRYKKVHDRGILWFSSEPTPELWEWVEYCKIPKGDEILEVGCGEGRDALFLAGKDYKISAIDVSGEGIKRARELAREKDLEIDFQVRDIVSDPPSEKFKWIYSIATLHMLVDDNDRRAFLKNLYAALDNGGKLLLVNMGDGNSEFSSDTKTAFELKERIHHVSKQKMKVASTTCRQINWENHIAEIKKAGFRIEKKMNTKNTEYQDCMTVYLAK